MGLKPWWVFKLFLLNSYFAKLKKQSSDTDATLHPSLIAMTSNEFDA